MVLRALSRLIKMSDDGDAAAVLKMPSRWPGLVVDAIREAYLQLADGGSGRVPRQIIEAAIVQVGGAVLPPAKVVLRTIYYDIAARTPFPDMFRLRDFRELCVAISLRVLSQSSLMVKQPSRGKASSWDGCRWSTVN